MIGDGQAVIVVDVPVDLGQVFLVVHRRGGRHPRTGIIAVAGQGGGAATPDYEVSMRYYENGVPDELKMDFGEFVVDGRLGELQPIPSPC